MKIINAEEFNETIKSGLTLVDFFAEWCGPCKTMIKVVEKALDKFPSLEFEDIDVEDNIKKALKLTKLQTKYEIELCFYILLSDLQIETMAVGKNHKHTKKKDLTGPEMIKRLAEIIMLNRDQDKETIENIKEILLNWEV